jgi:GNAT superfamily N-acetyltransferase
LRISRFWPNNWDAMEIVENPTAQQLLLVREFYTSVGYNTPIAANDKTIVVFLDATVVGVVRLAFEHDNYVLRGMQVARDYQGQGIGTMLLKALDAKIGTHICWCLPHGWLEKFYGQVGFEVVEESRAPVFLQERIQTMRGKYPDLIVMVKNLEK